MQKNKNSKPKNPNRTFYWCIGIGLFLFLGGLTNLTDGASICLFLIGVGLLAYGFYGLYKRYADAKAEKRRKAAVQAAIAQLEQHRMNMALFKEPHQMKTGVGNNIIVHFTNGEIAVNGDKLRFITPFGDKVFDLDTVSRCDYNNGNFELVVGGKRGLVKDMMSMPVYTPDDDYLVRQVKEYVDTYVV